jgi:gliding motility-associated-like protein
MNNCSTIRTKIKLAILVYGVCAFPMVIVTHAQNPTFEWAKSMGGTDNEAGNSMAVDASGNIYTTGYFGGSADFDPGTGTFNLSAGANPDIFVLKLDASGNFVWAKQFGAIQDDRGLSIALDASGDVYFTGYYQDVVDFDPGAGTFNLSSSGSYDVFVCKLDASGNFVWAKSIGGTGGDVGRSLVIDPSGNVLISGFYNGTTDFDPGVGVVNLTSVGPGTDDIFILKLNPSGNFLWAKTIGGGDNGDDGNSIAVDASGNVYATGSYELTADFDPGAGTFNLTSVGFQDIFVCKLDASGNFVWARSMGGTDDDDGLAVKVDATGNVFASGFYSEATDFNPGAGTFNLTPSDGDDIFILKLDPSGDFIWAKSLGGTGNDNGFSMALDAAGNVYTSGFFEGTADFDPSTAVLDLTAVGGYDIFINKLDAAGNFAWAVNMGGTSLDRGQSITLDATGNVYTTGAYRFTADFDPGTGTFNLTYAGNAGNTDMFIQKLSMVPTPVPTIISFTPAEGLIGTSVNITGTNFSTTPANNLVKFNGVTAIATSSSATSISTTVPIGATTGKITVAVGGNTATSATNFTVTTTPGNQPPIIITTTTAVQIEGIVTVDLLPLISDPDNDLDISTLELLSSESDQGASAQINTDSQLILDYDGVLFFGTDKVTIQVCDEIPNCAQQELIIEVGGDLIIYNGFSPNGDSFNATWQIQNIEILPQTKNNKVTLYNRWGDEIFNAINYDNEERVFKGLNKNGNELPTGTYFYRIEFMSGLSTKTGFLVLKR